MPDDQNRCQLRFVSETNFIEGTLPTDFTLTYTGGPIVWVRPNGEVLSSYKDAERVQSLLEKEERFEVLTAEESKFLNSKKRKAYPFTIYEGGYYTHSNSMSDLEYYWARMGFNCVQKGIWKKHIEDVYKREVQEALDRGHLV